jgi:hypothetical protein
MPGVAFLFQARYVSQKWARGGGYLHPSAIAQRRTYSTVGYQGGKKEHEAD